MIAWRSGSVLPAVPGPLRWRRLGGRRTIRLPLQFGDTVGDDLALASEHRRGALVRWSSRLRRRRSLVERRHGTVARLAHGMQGAQGGHPSDGIGLGISFGFDLRFGRSRVALESIDAVGDRLLVAAEDAGGWPIGSRLLRRGRLPFPEARLERRSRRSRDWSLAWRLRAAQMPAGGAVATDALTLAQFVQGLVNGGAATLGDHAKRPSVDAFDDRRATCDQGETQNRGAQRSAIPAQQPPGAPRHRHQNAGVGRLFDLEFVIQGWHVRDRIRCLCIATDRVGMLACRPSGYRRTKLAVAFATAP